MKSEYTNTSGRIFLTIRYEPENYWVYNNWLGSQTQDGIRQGADACLAKLVENKCTYLLNDNRLVAGPWSQATEWLIANWVPRAVTSGLTHMAHVISPEALARLSAENFHHRIDSAFQMYICASLAQATAWLKQAQFQTSKRN